MLILESVCQDASFLATILFIKKLVQIISYIVPALLVLLITIDITKAVVANSDDDIKKAQKVAIKRIIVSLVVFFVPIIVEASFSILGDLGTSWTDCYTNATDDVVETLVQAEKEKLIAYEADRQKLIEAAKANKAAKQQQLKELREQAKNRSKDSSSSSETPGTVNTTLSQTVLQSVQKVGGGIDSHDFVYSNNSPFSSTYDAAIKDKLYKTNCALAVCWIYKDAGVIAKDKKCFWFDKTEIHHKKTLTSGGKISLSKPDHKTIKSLVSSGALTPGDAIGTCDYRHTTMYIGQNDKGKYIFADAGHTAVKNKTVSRHIISGKKKVCILAHLK